MKLLMTDNNFKEVIKGEIFHVKVNKNLITFDIKTGDTSYSFQFVETNPIRRNKIFDSLASVEGNDFVEIERCGVASLREIETMWVNLKPVVDIKTNLSH